MWLTSPMSIHRWNERWAYRPNSRGEHGMGMIIQLVQVLLTRERWRNALSVCISPGSSLPWSWCWLWVTVLHRNNWAQENARISVLPDSLCALTAILYPSMLKTKVKSISDLSHVRFYFNLIFGFYHSLKHGSDCI